MKQQDDLEKEQLKATIAAQAQALNKSNQKIQKLEQESIILNNQKNTLKQESIILNNQKTLLEQENLKLRAKIQQLLHERYSKKSEKIPEEDLPVIDEAVVTPEEAATIETTEQEIAVAGYTRKKPKRKPIPTFNPSCGHN